MKNRINFIKDNNAFTLVELLVAMTVFIVLLSIAVGVFINSLRTQKKLLSEMAVNNAMNVALEQISRDIRTGFSFLASGGNTELSFTGRGRRAIKYGLSGVKIFRSVDGDSKDLTSDNIRVEKLQFLIGVKDECEPWRVTVVLQVKPLLSPRVFNIQTTVSSRVLPADTGLAEFRKCSLILNP